jgi:copper(I)-binding protein
MNIFKSVAVATALTLVSLSAFAQDYKAGDLTLSQAWTRATPPKAKAGGGFVEIVNAGPEDDQLGRGRQG